jgi:ABC-type transport system involved in multi-copper enzyme maturation permease subunit
VTPIVALLRRELFERVRATSHFVMRTAYVTVLLFVVVIIIWQSLISSLDQPLSRAPELGQMLFGTFTVLQYGMVLILVPLLGAGAVVDERKERSLQLLVLTELDPWQITTGKFLARFGVISLIVLSNVPILFFTALLGGVEPLDVVRIFSLTLGTAGLLLGVGVAISAVARSTITSAMITYTILVGFLLAPLGLVWVDPGWYVHWHAPTVVVLAIAEPLQIQGVWWHSPLASLAIAAAFLGLATAALRRDVRRTRVFKSGGEATGRPVWVWSNPIAWREWSRRGRPWMFWGLAAGAGISLAILQAFVVDKHDQDDAYIAGLMVTQFLALLYALAFGSGAFAQEKREQTLDLLRLTHMRSGSILFGKLAGVLRIALGFALVVLPPLAVCVALDRDTQWPVLLAVPVALTISMIFVACVSMFWSLNANSPLRAALPAVGTMLYLCLGIFMWPLLIFQDDDAIPISVAIGWLGIFGPVLFLLARANQRDFSIGASLVAGWCTAAVLCGFAVSDAEWSLLAIHPFGLEALSFLLFNEDPRNGAAWALVVGAGLLLFASAIFLWASTVLLDRQSALQDEGTRDNPIVALWLGLLLPGAGHIYLGELKKGLLYLCLGPLILCGLGIVNLISAVQAYQIADERRTARRARAEQLRDERQAFRRARESL